MYSQLYFHPVRRIYDIHLKEFLQEWLPGGRFQVELGAHLKLSDNDVLVAIREAASEASKPGHEAAQRFMQRGHFRLLYEQNDRDQSVNAESLSLVHKEAGTSLEMPQFGWTLTSRRSRVSIFQC